VGVDEVTDEVLADESQEVAEVLGFLTPEDWGVVRGNDARAEILDIAEDGYGRGGVNEAWRAIQLFLAALRL